MKPFTYLSLPVDSGHSREKSFELLALVLGLHQNPLGIYMKYRGLAEILGLP